jgi:hypothetical protein
VVRAGTLAVLAFLMLSRPWPWPSASVVLSWTAVDRSSALTWSGVRVGRFYSSSATAPEVTAAAWLVPLPRA